MAKKVSEIEKNQIIDSFKKGQSIKDLSIKYKFSEQTITRHLKNNLDASLFLKIKNQGINKVNNNIKTKYENIEETREIEKDNESFFEIVPLSDDYEFANHQEISSIPLKDVKLPDVVYMIVDKKVELETKLLKDFPEWRFLPEEDLQRKALRIFSDQRKGKKICSSNQKLIKVPNSNVFMTVSNKLISKGISRIIFDDSLIAI